MKRKLYGALIYPAFMALMLPGPSFAQTMLPGPSRRSCSSSSIELRSDD